MTYNFCTLFDRNYLYKGLALYYSLRENCKDFNFWIACFDDITYSVLKKQNLKNVILIAKEDFEDEELLRIKPTRTVAEYCWTCTSSLPLYILKQNPDLDMITYIDADIFFYSDPLPVFLEFGNNSIMIIEHRFAPEHKHHEIFGRYNVEMVTFRNNNDGLECLEWWRERCIEWCFAKYEDGKFGDQAYLNDWPSRFKNVHVLQHKGAGLAPWNISKYNIHIKNDEIFVDNVKLIFYHFHEFKILKRGFELCDYAIPRNIRSIIYEPYISAIKRTMDEIYKIEPDFNFGYSKRMLKSYLPNMIVRTLKTFKMYNAVKSLIDGVRKRRNGIK
jgi:hypothetical protein